jgi:hypothetical protein
MNDELNPLPPVHRAERAILRVISGEARKRTLLCHLHLIAILAVMTTAEYAYALCGLCLLPFLGGDE